MDNDDLKKQVKKWAEKVEYRHALLALVNGGLSPSLADMLIKGTYISTPKGKTVDILKKILANEARAS